MTLNIKQFAELESHFAPGHNSCSGCGFPMIVRNILKAAGKPTVACVATGCLEVTSTTWPLSSWKIPCIHNTFENAAATISGVESAYKALKNKGRMRKDIKFVAFAGDGGTYDIGLQSLSGMLERGHNVVYVLYDNEAYMNTGGQRSSATPYGAATTTTPAGKILKGKNLFRKNITRIIAAHDIPYVAQAAMHSWSDLHMKAKKAFSVEGPAFINVFSPCPFGWKLPTNFAVEISKRAVNSNFWPLYEVENGVWKLNYKPAHPLPVEKFLEPQGRFRHLFLKENRYILDLIQENVDINWKKLVRRSSEGGF